VFDIFGHLALSTGSTFNDTVTDFKSIRLLGHTVMITAVLGLLRDEQKHYQSRDVTAQVGGCHSKMADFDFYASSSIYVKIFQNVKNV